MCVCVCKTIYFFLNKRISRCMYVQNIAPCVLYTTRLTFAKYLNCFRTRFMYIYYIHFFFSLFTPVVFLRIKHTAEHSRYVGYVFAVYVFACVYKLNKSLTAVVMCNIRGSSSDMLTRIMSKSIFARI